MGHELLALDVPGATGTVSRNSVERRTGRVVPEKPPQRPAAAAQGRVRRICPLLHEEDDHGLLPRLSRSRHMRLRDGYGRQRSPNRDAVPALVWNARGAAERGISHGVAKIRQQPRGRATAPDRPLHARGGARSSLRSFRQILHGMNVPGRSTCMSFVRRRRASLRSWRYWRCSLSDARASPRRPRCPSSSSRPPRRTPSLRDLSPTRAGKISGLGVVVVDTSGELIAGERMDGAPGRNIMMATAKAFTSVMYRTTTAKMSELYKTSPDRYFGIMNLYGNKVYLVGGGMPLAVDGKLVGAVGVAGLPNGQDEAAATAGLAAWEKVRATLPKYSLSIDPTAAQAPAGSA